MDDEKLIEAVKNHPVLYNPKHPDNKIIQRKENAWKAVKEAVGSRVFGSNNVVEADCTKFHSVYNFLNS